MKVVIDNYPKHLTSSYDWLQSVYNFLWNNRTKRKVKVHIDDHDMWNMDCTLAHIIVPMLYKLKDDKHGCPLVDDEDCPDDISSHNAPVHEEWEIDDNCEKRWNYIIGEIIWAMEQIRNDESDHPDYPLDHDKLFTPKKNLNGEDTKLLEEYHKEVEDYYNRLMNGTRLFGKYFTAMWT